MPKNRVLITKGAACLHTPQIFLTDFSDRSVPSTRAKRAADTVVSGLSAAGVLAVSLGLSRIYDNDLEQSDAERLQEDRLWAGDP
ncbi:hypothetical protein [Bradyrhizobium neotropicale]|uniref:Uncharacterized protein n=1 Tax=Bradyrhizobium neotropicale TaxID=1497615 RepID=A0A176Z2Z3_9BRAD|nr:hypothetical protein [Bradyrhizobium neotropicale]OAF15028.1 hypothetical protein AXW67_16815 [Bradyrhizobium neotropicale]